METAFGKNGGRSKADNRSDREKRKYLMFLLRVCCSLCDRFYNIFGFNVEIGERWTTRSYETEVEEVEDGPKVSKIGQAGRRSSARERSGKSGKLKRGSGCV